MGIQLNQIPKEVRDRLGLKNPPAYKQFWAIVGDKKVYFRSSWEYYYALFLAQLKHEGKIRDWVHEQKTFWFEKIKRGRRSYLPDFMITHLNGSEEYIETKGYMCSQSITKLKRMALYYPEVKIRVVGSDWFKKNIKLLKSLEPFFARRCDPPVQ